jgi:predicted ATPase/DNA-binding CsgD family transcriptional regulator
MHASQQIDTGVQLSATGTSNGSLALEITERSRIGLPLGTVTFLLSEFDGTNEDRGRFESVLDAAIADHGGVCFRSPPQSPPRNDDGNLLVAAFGTASDAVHAARTAQLNWLDNSPDNILLRVHMTAHTGEAQLITESQTWGRYVGPAIRRLTRLHQLGHGGQVLVSSASRDLAVDQLGDDIVLDNLGEYRLKDLARPEHIYQLRHPGLPSIFPRLRSLDAFPNNLPLRLSTFIGRHAELKTMEELLELHRLVTIIGSGGAGKTRIALQSAAEQVGEHIDGVWWIELAPLTEPDAVAVALAEVLDISLRESRSPDSALTRALSTSNALIVFDNCEHVHDAAGRLVLLLLEHCPHLQILATSRSPLDVPGEVTWRVPPLALPEQVAGNPHMTVEKMSQFESVQLFMDRARMARPTFALTNANAPDVAEICARVDGIPLAIELAAARTKTLLPNQILEGLDDALRLLSGGSQLLLPRQQTLEASIRWSSALLDEPARALLHRLSVFSGSFGLTAAETVCVGGVLNTVGVLTAIERLVDQSLITPLDGANEGRFTALETVRQFGARQLSEEASTDDVRQHHALYYAHVASEFGPKCETAEQFGAVARLEIDIANIRSALNWLREHDFEMLASMVIALGPFWDVSGDKFEGAAWATKVLSVLPANESIERARLLALRGECRMSLGEWTGSFADCQAAIAEAALVDDAYALGRGNSTLTSLLSVSASVEEWQSQWAKTVTLQRAANDQYGLGGTLTWGAVPLLRRGYLKAAAEPLHLARSVIERGGSPGLLASQQFWEGYSAVLEGRPADAERLALAALNSGALGSAPRIAGAESVLWAARGQLGLDRRTPDEHAEAAGAADRRGEHQASHVRALLAGMEGVRRDPAWARATADDWLGKNENTPTIDQLEIMAIGVVASLRLGELDETFGRSEAILKAANTAGSVLYRARSQTWRATVQMLRGEMVEADHLIRESIRLLSENGVRFFLCEAIEVLAILAARCNDHHEAARLLGAVRRIREEMQSRRSMSYDDMLNEARAAVSAAIGHAAFVASFDDGAALSDDDLVIWIERTRGTRGRPTIGWSSLTPTEIQVTRLVREGLTNREIAQRLLMGAETVKTHLSHIFTKLDLSKRSQLAALATEHET